MKVTELITHFRSGDVFVVAQYRRQGKGHCKNKSTSSISERQNFWNCYNQSFGVVSTVVLVAVELSVKK